ncbi:13788_t:CDS:2 [Ambispora leptoticha]|uniref:13788_t:CDS:1 n=1 Tax=Ambispora leptoticha TaxID=144679 RepID=A0A9N9B2F8_9GLOM|nr:13788_t:CDS:2 [Ambispora leptoticha]
MVNLSEKVLIITGGASGFGKALAHHVVEKGAKVVLADINKELGLQVEAELNTSKPNYAKFVCTDVSKRQDLENLLKVAETEFGGFDAIFNNAGIAQREFFDQTESWKRTIDININAVIEGTQLSIPFLKKRGGGAVINTASVAGLYPLIVPRVPVYTAAKAAVVAFSQALEHLKDEENIRVNAVCPFFAETPMVTTAYQESKDFEAYVKKIGTVSIQDVVNGLLHAFENDALYGDVIEILPKNKLYVRPKVSY